MSYFAPYIDETGLHMPTYEERLEDLCTAYRAIFGPEAELSPAVPDYQLLSVLARALDDTAALVLAAYNSRNPAYAQGQALDLLLPQVGLRRRGATYSEAELTLTGTAGSIIPAGSAAADEKGGLAKRKLLGTFKQKGKTELTVTLEVPIELGNEHMNKLGIIPWTFIVEEIPEDTTPHTGDWCQSALWLSVADLLLLAIVLVLLAKRRARRAQ